MLIKKSGEIPYSEVTPKSVYLNRRDFMKAAGGVGVVLAAGRAVAGPDSALAGTKLQYTKSDLSTQGETLTPLKDITTYNNFYEFGTNKAQPAQNAGSFRTNPWTLKIEGHCKKPTTYDIDKLMKVTPLEERIYRLRCVEAWSVVVPWAGFPWRKC